LPNSDLDEHNGDMMWEEKLNEGSTPPSSFSSSSLINRDIISFIVLIIVLKKNKKLEKHYILFLFVSIPRDLICNSSGMFLFVLLFRLQTTNEVLSSIQTLCVVKWRV